MKPSALNASRWYLSPSKHLPQHAVDRRGSADGAALGFCHLSVTCRNPRQDSCLTYHQAERKHRQGRDGGAAREGGGGVRKEREGWERTTSSFACQVHMCCRLSQEQKEKNVHRRFSLQAEQM